jgi:hypothetical protein
MSLAAVMRGIVHVKSGAGTRLGTLIDILFADAAVE